MIASLACSTSMIVAASAGPIESTNIVLATAVGW
jgi:hypothetical protein